MKRPNGNFVRKDLIVADAPPETAGAAHGFAAGVSLAYSTISRRSPRRTRLCA
ncbi:MAG: hypothetical protein M5R36_12175 [Deltaproteobacteria bacterium]|nr:hypothetical protein [Deltaproteobacteria bacterium]